MIRRYPKREAVAQAPAPSHIPIAQHQEELRALEVKLLEAERANNAKGDSGDANQTAEMLNEAVAEIASLISERDALKSQLETLKTAQTNVSQAKRKRGR